MVDARRLISCLFAACLTACGDRDTERPQVPQTAAERGRELVATLGCVACHSLDGTRGIGPTWQGLAGSVRLLRDGREVVADESYLRRAMLDPGAEIVESFDSLMIAAPVTEAQLGDIMALLVELADNNKDKSSR